MSSRSHDEQWMRRCLELAARAQGRTSPNPLVGSVIVQGNEKIAEGYHTRAGKPHAEAVALRKAGERAKGATLYVNLEPCNHEGRTPPCAPAIVEAGISRVVFGMRDPFRTHGGAALLKRKGVKVEGGILAEECADQNRFFTCLATNGRPYFVLKTAMSLDARVATRSGESQWVTGRDARSDGHTLRSNCDAIVVGIGTVLADDPRLTARGKGQRDPVRVILDSSLRTPPTARMFKGRDKPRTIIATTPKGTAEREEALVKAGAEVWRLGKTQQVSLRALARRLGKEGIMSVLAEGGPTVHDSLFALGLADELVCYIAPTLLGRDGLPWSPLRGPARLKDAPRFRVVETAAVGEDMRLRFVRR